MRDHRKLRVFKLADELVVRVYEATKGFPKEELFGLTNQLRRSVVSVPSNIVEGCARRTQREYLRHLDIAYASTKEVEYQLTVACKLHFLEPSTAASVAELADKTARHLNNLIRSLS